MFIIKKHIMIYLFISVSGYNTAIAADNDAGLIHQEEENNPRIELDDYSWITAQWMHDAVDAMANDNTTEAASFLSHGLISSPGTSICCKWSCSKRDEHNAVIEETLDNGQVNTFLINTVTNEGLNQITDRIKAYLDERIDSAKGGANNLAQASGNDLIKCLKDIYYSMLVCY